ncbi:MAG: response regulator [Pirellulales bacterium]|nr:response regulator [Pirellulales bacterium]
MNSVLLVEDNELNRMVIEDLFDYDDVPATLVSVASGEEALDAARRNKPILVLMDLELPGLSGLETMRHLKNEPETRDVPVWAFSAHAMKGDAAQALSAGFDDYVTKPIDTKQFAQRLREFLDGVLQKETSSCANR